MDYILDGQEEHRRQCEIAEDCAIIVGWLNRSCKQLLVVASVAVGASGHQLVQARQVVLVLRALTFFHGVHHGVHLGGDFCEQYL